VVARFVLIAGIIGNSPFVDRGRGLGLNRTMPLLPCWNWKEGRKEGCSLWPSMDTTLDTWFMHGKHFRAMFNVLHVVVNMRSLSWWCGVCLWQCWWCTQEHYSLTHTVTELVTSVLSLTHTVTELVTGVLSLARTYCDSLLLVFSPLHMLWQR
jgi:hypothetical protein